MITTMTGPEHHRAAEKLLRDYDLAASKGVDMPNLLAQAQVHANLAVAAAVEALAMPPSTRPGTVTRSR